MSKNTNIKEVVARVFPARQRSKIEELFLSLQKELETAVDKKFGSAYWLWDFSKDTVMLRRKNNALQPAGVGDDLFYQVKWKFGSEGVEFDGSPAEVRRVVTFI